MSQLSFPDALRLVAFKHRNDTQRISSSTTAVTTKHMTVKTFYNYIEEVFNVMNEGRSDLLPNQHEPKSDDNWHPKKVRTRKMKESNPDQLELFPDFKDVNDLPF